MKYPCGIIRDLMPLCIDDVCGSESKNAVKAHISECGECRKYYIEMSETSGFTPKENNNSEDKKMADSLKEVKTKIDKKIRNIGIGAVSAALVFTVGFQVLFNAPIMSVDKGKVKVTAEVYPLSELPHNVEADDASVKISSGESDNSDVYKVVISGQNDMQIGVSENVMDKDGVATVITTSSDYFLKKINWETKDDTIYISSFKTTLLGNKAEKHQKTMTSLEFREINKIVFVENESETVLWER